jgi:hypothetical protein
MRTSGDVHQHAPLSLGARRIDISNLDQRFSCVSCFRQRATPQAHPAASPTMEDVGAFSTRLLIAVYVDGFAGADVVPVEPVDVGGSRIAEDATKPRTIPNRSLSSA